MVEQARYFTTVSQEDLPLHLGKGAEGLLDRGNPIADSTELHALVRRPFAAYAPPMLWGPSVAVASHLGAVTYTIEYSAVGDTLVMGRVTYWKGEGGGRKVTEEFRDRTTITTSNSVGTVECEFKGVPLGSAVDGSCSP
jgi:hypothetical protein